MLNEEIDAYCERMSAEFWAEPLNAVTNLAFILAAIFAYKFWKNNGNQRREIFALVIITALVGVGSFLFHTFAVYWALLADIIPIAIFIYVAIGIFFRRVVGLSPYETFFGLVAYGFFGLLATQSFPPEMLNGSVEYAPALIALIGFALFTKSKGFAFASVLFIVSIIFRSLDMQLCDVTNGIGTHIIWHTLNGLLLYTIIRSLIIADEKLA